MAPTDAQSPRVHVIAGPNGAGKTTFATDYLPSFANCREFVNADLIAWGLSPFAPESQAMRAGRLVLTRIQELAAAGSDFAFETTLSGRTYVPILTRLREHGYRIHLFFLWLPAADLAVARVANRARQGGHDIPEPAIRRRFNAGLMNFGALYATLADDWWIFDASRQPPALVAEHHNEEEATVIVHDPATYAAVVSSRSVE
ncbi:AAA family ATPase [Paludisphaera sp.]|uniref:AAA family ATPase n=1 Tax=Paludisphaera sp. TaxID=2017432 RepID=UPI00301DFDD4